MNNVIINMQALEDRVGGDTELLAEIIQIFFDRSPDVMASMRRAIGSQDAKGLPETIAGDQATNRNHKNVGIDSFELPNQFSAVHSGHIQISQDQPDLVPKFRVHGYSLNPVGRNGDTIAIIAEDRANQIADCGLVIDNKNEFTIPEREITGSGCDGYFLGPAMKSRQMNCESCSLF